ncbi:MAG: SUMF1/EgtB/PvdO family nonheme iron enzyme [Prevotella sp.]|nr:SUMF1/EgtB/PvdO family nonheme iron enzyme [Candidatus Prevotella equi]
MNYILHAYAVQDIGQRNSQEDSFYPPFIDPCHFDEVTRDWALYDGTAHTDERLFIVCDGMGGHDRGELASRVVTQTMSRSLLRSASIEGAFNDEILKIAVSESLAALAKKDMPDEVMKMGTTMTMLKFHANGVTVGHIGDSRVYHFRPAQQSQPAKMLFRTEDHTVVNDMVHNGQITYAQARQSSKKHVLSRAMMACQEREPEVEINHITDIKTGDIFMLCSDGMYENMSDDDFLKLMTDPNYTDVQRIQRLLHDCIDNKDNRTAIIIRVQEIINTPDKMAPDASLTPGTVLKSENYTYHIERVLGHGAFGITYLVNTSISMQGQLGTIHTGVKVALKEFYMEKEMKRVGSELVTQVDKERVANYAEKFRHEAKKLAMLSHPNIVKVLEVFEANNTIYYSMEYLPDGTLNDYVNKRGGLPEKEAIGCIRQVGSALKYMHTNKMLHLDIKPANVMRVESSDTLKIIDFGLSKRFANNGDPESSSNLGYGTPGYASLEQVDGNIEHDFSPELDVYALGATYYKILTGLTPSNAIDVLNRGINTLPLVKKNVSQKSIDAIKAAMEPTKAKRLKSVDVFIDMLPRVDDETIFVEKKDNHVLYISIIAIIVSVLCFLAGRYIVGNNNNVENEETEIIPDKNFTIEMVKVDGGTFTMGSTAADAEEDEAPCRKITLSTYYISKYEITQAQWHSVMSNKKQGNSKNGRLPVYNVTWEKVQVFIERINKKTGRRFRLPTEAEWEYAARGGINGRHFSYSGDRELDSIAWYSGNSVERVHPVGQLKPNELGIYDMSGNVWEMCSDWYGNYEGDNLKNPKGTRRGDWHVIRGGCWNSSSTECRNTFRQDESLLTATMAIGFRLVEVKK